MTERPRGEPSRDSRAALQSEYITNYFALPRNTRLARERLGDQFDTYVELVQTYITDFLGKPVSYQRAHPEVREALKERTIESLNVKEWANVQRIAKSIYQAWLTSLSRRTPSRHGTDPHIHLDDHTRKDGLGWH